MSLKFPNKINPTTEFSNLISKGITRYPKYSISTKKVAYHEDNLVELSSTNLGIIKTEISRNDMYKFNFAKMVYDSFVGTPLYRTRDFYVAILRIIDFENSTQILRFNRIDFYNIIDYIMKDEPMFYARLGSGDSKLVEDITGVCSKQLLSFASKICKFLNNLMFGKDDYFIYDYYVVNILAYYLDWHRSNNTANYKSIISSFTDKEVENILNGKNYKNFYTLMESLNNLVKTTGSTFSRDDLFKIMWYCYRSFDISENNIHYI